MRPSNQKMRLELSVAWARMKTLLACATVMLAFGAAGAAAETSAEASTRDDTSTQDGVACGFPADLAARILIGDIDFGDLPVDSQFVIDEALLLDQGRRRATVEGRLNAGPLELLPSATVCVFLLLDVDGEAILAHQQRIDIEDFSTVAGLRYVLRVDLPEGTRRMTFVVREGTTGIWGAAPMEQPGTAPAGPGLSAVRVAEHEGTYYELTYRPTDGQASSGASSTEPPEVISTLPTPRSVPRRTVPPAPSASTGSSVAIAGEPLIRLIPPRQQPATGSTLFDCLVSSLAVDKVVFEIDGEVVEEDGRKPFRARMSLAKPAREQTVRAIAYDSLGTVMGEDTVIVNRLDVPFRVRITSMTGDPAAGSVELAAEVSVPRDGRLERVEIYRNGDLVESQRQPPFGGTVPTPSSGPDDFLRVAAFLTDGQTIDDVVLLGAGDIDDVEVNLVQLHAVVNDDAGRAVTDLEAGDFSVRIDGQSRPIDNFAHAKDVPLVMGLMIDTSGSMELLMHDTRRAAARFLGSTLLAGDQAFLVDFDLQPRLLHGMTADLPALLRDLGKLNADGRTAMYDAVIFSLLQFGEVGGRRALVVLTDGDDLDSRYGPKHSVEMAQKLGVPVYLIGLGALDTQRRVYDKSALRKLTEESGGRLYFVDSFDELAEAYVQINAELRSQYTLGFYADRDLDDQEKRRLTVEVPAGLRARTVVGTTSVE